MIMSSDTIASTTVTELNRQVDSLRKQLSELQETGVTQISGQVHSHPVASLFVAFFLGILGGQLLRR
jgi:DNA invertase Pin-like site-specific DNA recombinase